jgi:hypothetical protein
MQLKNGLNNLKRNKMEKEFIPYEQALDLKELGFNEPCFGYYYSMDNKKVGLELYIDVRNQDVYYVSAPLYQQAFRWFRNKHKHLKFFIKEGFREGLYEYEMKDVLGVSGFKTNEEAELECLKKLIEIIKNKKKL